MKTLNDIKNVMGYRQSDENFIDYLGILNINGILIFTDGDISEVNGVLVASDHLYDQLISVYGSSPEFEEMKIG